jgi:hypothetical protein
MLTARSCEIIEQLLNSVALSAPGRQFYDYNKRLGNRQFSVWKKIYRYIFVVCDILVSTTTVQIFSFLHHTEHNQLLLLYCVCVRPVWRFEPGSVVRPWLWWLSSHNFHTQPELYGEDSMSKQTPSEPLNRRTRLLNWTLSSGEADLCIVRSSTWSFPHCKWTK